MDGQSLQSQLGEFDGQVIVSPSPCVGEADSVGEGDSDFIFVTFFCCEFGWHIIWQRSRRQI